MRWKGRAQSKNVVDQRGATPGGMAAGGGLGMILLAALAFFFGGGEAVQKVLQADKAKRQRQVQQPRGGAAAPDDHWKEFVSVVLKDTEDVWTRLFAAAGQRYQPCKLNLFSGGVSTRGCGSASSAMGPFYCPADQQVYIDPTFFDELATKYKAPGDFAHACVIAHEVAHHVQNRLKWNRNANLARQSGNKRAANRASVRLELQADFLAGVWAHHAHKYDNILQSGDLNEAMRAATQIGDDTLQLKASGRTNPDTYTHGTAEQRKKWFMLGVQSGNFLEAQRIIDENFPYESL